MNVLKATPLASRIIHKLSSNISTVIGHIRIATADILDGQRGLMLEQWAIAGYTYPQWL